MKAVIDLENKWNAILETDIYDRKEFQRAFRSYLAVIQQT